LEPLLRGSIEHHIDVILGEKVLDNALEMFRKGLAPSVKDIEDALFGYVIGRTLEFSFAAVQVYYRRNPTDEEFKEIAEILERRAMEIKSKIRLIVNR